MRVRTVRAQTCGGDDREGRCMPSSAACCACTAPYPGLLRSVLIWRAHPHAQGRPMREPRSGACTVRAQAVAVATSPAVATVSKADTVALTGTHSCHNGAHLSKARKAELERVCEHIAQVKQGRRTACLERGG